LPQSKDTQVSCDARIDANSQILAILLLRFGAFAEKETRKRKRKENSPKIAMTRKEVSPMPQDTGPTRPSGLADSVPA
jgi:hypothetical protein